MRKHHRTHGHAGGRPSDDEASSSGGGGQNYHSGPCKKGHQRIESLRHRAKDKIEKSPKKEEFINHDGNRFVVTAQGLFYCPKARGAKKHSCPDCYFCQYCSDSRCSLCRRGQKPSPAEKGPFD